MERKIKLLYGTFNSMSKIVHFFCKSMSVDTIIQIKRVIVKNTSSVYMIDIIPQLFDFHIINDKLIRFHA